MRHVSVLIGLCLSLVCPALAQTNLPVALHASGWIEQKGKPRREIGPEFKHPLHLHKGETLHLEVHVIRGIDGDRKIEIRVSETPSPRHARYTSSQGDSCEFQITKNIPAVLYVWVYSSGTLLRQGVIRHSGVPKRDENTLLQL